MLQYKWLTRGSKIMKCETRTNKNLDDKKNCGIKPSKIEDCVDERLILKMDEEAPEHVFPESKTSSNKKSITDNIKKK